MDKENLHEQYYHDTGNDVEIIDHNGNHHYSYINWLEEKVIDLEENRRDGWEER